MKVSKVFEFKVYPPTDLEQILLHLLRNKSLSDTTKKQIAHKLTQWISYLDLKTLNNLLYNPAESVAKLYETKQIRHTPTNHHIYISAAVAYIKYITADTHLLNKWKEIEHKNSEPLADHYDKNKPTTMQSNKVISLSTLLEARKTLEIASFERLLLSFYTLIEPIRADYYATEIIPATNQTTIEPTEDNYIVIKEGAADLVVKDFKTKRKYTTIENKLSSELLDELNASLKKYPRKYLFVMDDKKSPFTRKLFSNWACRTLKRVLGYPMTLTAIRHAYITDKIQTKSATTELVDIARKMGHSRSIQRVYEWQ